MSSTFAKISHATTLAKHVARTPGEARYLLRLLRSRGMSTLETRQPWLPYALCEHLASASLTNLRVFEYGGGGSTAWFADRGADVVTVEHDAAWYELLNSAMRNQSTVQVMHRPLNGSGAYVDAIDQFEDDYFDLVVVDGRERIACATAAMAKVKPGGRLIFDDIERARYQPAFDLFSEWRLDRFDGLAPSKGELAHTAVWTRI